MTDGQVAGAVLVYLGAVIWTTVTATCIVMGCIRSKIPMSPLVPLAAGLGMVIASVGWRMLS